MTEPHPQSATVNTVLGPVPATDLGVVATHESLLSIYPGAEYAPEISIERSEIFATIATKLERFKSAGGGTVVDSTGMFHGRDLPLYESLSRSTGVHLVASTGLGPQRLLGGYFLTPQTNPPKPWPANKFAELFMQEITEGMVNPRIRRHAPAGLVRVAAAPEGITDTETSLFRGAARAGVETGVPVSVRYGSDPLSELEVLTSEGLNANRVLVGGLDRNDAVEKEYAKRIAERGAYIGVDHIGTDNDPRFVDDGARADLVQHLVTAGFGDRIILSSNAIGVARGQPGCDIPYEFASNSFARLLTSRGMPDGVVHNLFKENPAQLLAVRSR
ncbi:phosphotriesterase family protein [Rothia uropygialis]|uniref:phosphotriesterase family protein n=1 Tax=Kocuria sp. 36 TaxID=1415402 RepID=UPI00101E0193|nr:phosphotriesterase [Kocuria sp. 36]